MFEWFKGCCKSIFDCENNKEKNEGKKLYCPFCHKNIRLINKNLDINKNDDSKFEAIDINTFNNESNNNFVKKNLLDNEKKQHNYKERFQEMKNISDNDLNNINQQDIEEKIQLLEKREEALYENENKLEQKRKSLDEKEKKLNDKEKIFESEKKKEMNNQKIKEKSLIDLEKSLIKRENKYNEDLLKQQQKEELLNSQFQKLDSEKKSFEKEKEIFNLSKLPTEIGLQNIGATCYMNATLQALSNTKKFTEYFLSKFNFDLNDNSKKMANQMYKVLTNLWNESKKKGDYPPYDFKNTLSEENPLFAGIQANDSKDLINFLLERFHQELNTVNKNNQIEEDENVNQMDEFQTFSAFFKAYFTNNKSIIVDCFYGIVETRSKCVGCNITKFNFQIYSFLEFPLKEVNNYMFQLGRRFALVNNDGTNPDINLYECFDYYQKIDMMNGQNQMYCNICNDNRDTYYGTIVYSLPNYLILNLNRGKGAEYKCKVIFPEILNLLNYVAVKNGNTVMQLYAVICHYGPSSMSGHFIAYCRHRINNKWYKYNDSFVTECTQPNEYLNGMPYILFYRAIE